MTFGPHAGAHRVAIRAATSIAVPLVVLFLLDRMDLSIYASFGSLAALYGRFHYYGDRLRMQLGAGIVFITVMVVGTLLSIIGAQTTVRIMVIALIATVVTAIAIGYRWHPGGATFAVFAAGAVATIPATWVNSCPGSCCFQRGCAAESVSDRHAGVLANAQPRESVPPLGKGRFPG